MSEDELEPAPEPEPQPTEPAEGPVHSLVGENGPELLRWVDNGVFNSGIPNRDIYPADGLTDEQIELAVATGTHVKD